MDILTKRPENMGFLEYKEALRMQYKQLKWYKKGTTLFASTSVKEMFTSDGFKKEVTLKHTYSPNKGGLPTN